MERKSQKLRIKFKLIAENNFGIDSAIGKDNKNEEIVELDTIKQSQTLELEENELEMMPEMVKYKFEISEENEITVFSTIFKDVVINDDILVEGKRLIIAMKTVLKGSELSEIVKSLVSSEKKYLGFLTFLSILGVDDILDRYIKQYYECLTPSIVFYGLIVAMHHNKKEIVSFYLS